MSDRAREQLNEQLQAGVHLVHSLLTQTDPATLAGIKPALLRNMKRWAYLLPGHIPKGWAALDRALWPAAARAR